MPTDPAADTYTNADMPLAAIQVQPDPLQPKPTLAAERCEYCRM